MVREMSCQDYELLKLAESHRVFQFWLISRACSIYLFLQVLTETESPIEMVIKSSPKMTGPE